MKPRCAGFCRRCRDPRIKSGYSSGTRPSLFGLRCDGYAEGIRRLVRIGADDAEARSSWRRVIRVPRQARESRDIVHPSGQSPGSLRDLSSWYRL